jgi:hypothetical protein
MRTILHGFLFLLSFLAAGRLCAQQDIVISEFLAVNDGGLSDTDGDSPDWIELYNSGSEAASLGGWYLSDDPEDLFKWPLPEMDLGAGSYLVVFASGKDRRAAGGELHTNFSLDGDGEYLALVGPAGVPTTEFAPAFPRQQGGFSFGHGESQVGDQLVREGAGARMLVPSAGFLGLSWNGSLAGFNDSEVAGWIPVTTGIGYPSGGGPPVEPPIGYWSFDGNVNDTSGLGHGGGLHGADFSDQAPEQIGGGQSLSFDGSNDYVSVVIDVSETAYTASFWFRTETAGRGLFSVVDGDLGAGGHDRHIYLSGGNIATRVWNNQTIASSGRNFADGQWHHAAHVVGEGGQRIYVDGLLVRRGSKASSDFDWQRQLHIGFSNDAAGNYFEGQIDDVAVWSEALGPGHIRALSEGTHPLELGGLSSFVETDVEDSLRGVNSSVYLRIPFEASLPLDIDSLRLRVRCDDGFIAYLNGEELARRNAPDNAGYNSAALEDQPVAMALRQENIDITDRIDLLRDGENILAVHGLNDAAESEDFLLLPELVGVAEFADRYFENPTPGSPNDAGGSAGFVADTSFSVDRGVYEQGFDVEITCATEEATIRYTLDGSEPTATRGTIYAGPLSVNGTTTLRAAAFKEGLESSNVDTQTYIFPADVVTQSVMLRDITSHRVYGPLLEQALSEMPSISIVTPLGINFSSPVKASIEMLDYGGREGFQVDAGIKRVGGHSVNYPKNTMRLYFRSEYGYSKLKYPVFEGTRYGEGAAESFDQLDLRSGSHDSVFYLGAGAQRPSDALYLRNRWHHDALFEMGQLSLHGRFVHVYINGTYWGHYHMVERPTRTFMASYLGGEKEQYESINSGRTIGPASPAWSRLPGILNNYETARNWIDFTCLADYMVLNFYTGNDWDWSWNHNWMAAGPSTPGLGGYRFFNWDADITFRHTTDANLNQPGPGNLFRDSMRHEPFRRLLADRIHKHLFNGGVLTPERVQELFDLRAEQIQTTLVAETARWRWGGTVWTRDNQWESERSRLRTDFIPRRTDIVINQIRNAGWYPDVPAPTFLVDGRVLPGGRVDSGAELSMGVAGLERFVDRPVIDHDSSLSVCVPRNGDIGDEWQLPEYVEGTHGESWRDGSGGVGYENSNGYQEAIGIDVGEEMTGDPGGTAAFVRIPFTLADQAAIRAMTNLVLLMDYDDGFVAYINGERLAAENAPAAGSLQWNSRAAGSNEADPGNPDVFELSGFADHLRVGSNVLAIHGLNFSRTSSDFLIRAALVERTIEVGLPEGSVFYTIDGSDPSEEGALDYTEPFALDETMLVKARTREDGEWSALSEALFVVEGSLPLRITELMYHPPSAAPGAGFATEDYEFIELMNTGGRVLDLDAISLAGAVRFDFSEAGIDALAPGEHVLVVKNLAAFSLRYGAEGILVAGEYSGKLSNGGEIVELKGRFGETLLELEYADWYPAADGEGFTLVVNDPFAELDIWSDSDNWRSGSVELGTPGYTEDGGGPRGLRLPGDANQDGLLDVSDPVRLLRRLYLGVAGELPCDGEALGEGGNLTLLDSNGDSSVNLTDAVYLLSYMFQNGPSPVLGAECVRIEGCLSQCRR